MHSNNLLRQEGDINQSDERVRWQSHLSKETMDILDKDESIYLHQSMSTPCMNVITSCEGIYLYDKAGNKIMDFHGNSLHQVGYKNPYVKDAINMQMEKLPFVPRRYTADVVIEAAKRLNGMTTSKDYKVLFTPSGSASVGVALKLARKVTGKHKVISMWEAFHGAGLDAISVGGDYVFKKDMGPTMPGSIKIMPYNAFRNVFGEKHPEIVANRCLDYLEYSIEHEGDIGAIILEPVRATDIHVPPKTYFERLRAICDKYGILLIFDEIPTAIGRSGTFYVHQNFEVEPDILVLGKGLGGGMIPQAAVLVKKSLDCAGEISLGHYTHEKPALGSAAIIGMLDFMEDKKIMGHVNTLSTFMKEEATSLKNRFSCIGDMRQIGMMISFELVKENNDKDTELAEKVMYSALRKGLSSKVGSGNCITWHPPLITTKDEMQKAFSIFEKTLTELSS